MSELTQHDKGNLPPDEEAMAADLDRALDEIRAGRAVDRAALLARYPALAGALEGLDQLLGDTSTVPAANGPPGPTEHPEVIGRYRIERRLGFGGFGNVYLAFDPEVKRQVAVKVLHPNRINQPEVLARFRREARAIGRLQHPGIVRLFELGPSGPPFYLVTEYIDGVDPREWVRAQGSSPRCVAELVIRLCEAVEYAHGHGVFHRDLKPGNVIVDADGQPHVLDFGLARLDGSQGSVSEPTSDGHIFGSLPYMPPECAAGRSHTADARSDIYSLGVMLYELLTSKLPFQGPAHALPARVIEEKPAPPRGHNRRIPRDLEAICLKALAKNPADRYGSAAELGNDLRAFLDGRRIRAARHGLVSRVRDALNRRHLDTLRKGWTPLLLLLGTTILAGCSLVNYWEIILPPEQQLLPTLLTKLGQVVLMLFFAVRLRPLAEPSEEQRRQPPMTAAERQIWSLVPAYYGAFVALLVLNWFLSDPIPLAPVLAVLSGMGFVTLGATIWGWFYVWGAGFFVLAVLIVLAAPYGLTLLGVGWFLCLVVGSIHLNWGR